MWEMKRLIVACVVGGLIVGVAYADWDDLPVTDEVHIEDRRALWNGHFGDRTKGEDAFKGGEVHGWVHPLSLVPMEPDPYPHSYDGRPPPRRWYDSKNGLR